jgi:assimilatory nitrate reductase catalytic subunit
MQRDQPPAAVRTTCPYCGVGCGVLALAHADGSADIAGDPDHPANFGRLCSKGVALGETLSLDDRLLHPLIHGAQASWDEALDCVATRFRETVAEHGPDSVAFYVSGQILTEDYYVANKLMKGFIGSANIDTNSRLCMASSVAGHKRAFGSDTVPGNYRDLELADLVVLAGSNLAWCHPILFQRLAAAKDKRGTKVVVIDPRSTATCDLADMHLALAPGSDVALFNGLLTHLHQTGNVDHTYIDKYTSGFDAALTTAETTSISELATVTGLAESDISKFYALFAATEKTVTVYSQGVNQSTSGTDKVNAIINCHLATGRIGKPGMGPFSVTGQPNAMGGREVGGMANMLACHMELGNADHRRIVQSFWESPRIATEPGLKAVDMFRAVGDGRIKALWIMATNPVDSMPRADNVREALRACPFVAVSDVARQTDTTGYANVLLPSLAWGEKDGTVTNSERRISRQRAFLAAPGEARADWWQLAEVGKRMGFADAFTYANAAAIFAEYAELSGLENDATRDFDIGAHADISGTAYNKLQPFQWPQAAGTIPKETRFFASGEFFTPDQRARFIAIEFRPVACTTTPEFPLILNTGRIRDQWHTMTRTAKTARLMSHIAEPFVEIHPDDAQRLGLDEAELAEVRSPHGQIIVRTLITARQRPGSVFVPMHWTDQMANAARVCALINANTDPISGQPELKAAPVSVKRFAACWYGFAVSRAKPTAIPADYWVLATAKSGWRVELAGQRAPEHWDGFVRSYFNLKPDGTTDVLAYRDECSGQHRFAIFDGDQLIGALFVAASPVTVSRTFAADRLDAAVSDPRDRFCILAGRAGAAERDRGSIVCACFEIGFNQIVEAVTAGNCMSLAAVGAALEAGTNCGSCRPEIGRIIVDHAIAKGV